MKTSTRKQLPTPRRALCIGIYLCCFLWCVAAFGGAELIRTYDYKGYDTNGNLLVTGVITLHVIDKEIPVKGSWRLQILDTKRFIETGPQDGVGKVVGQMQNDHIFLNLDPDQFENNIYLEGAVAKASIFKIKGKWGYYGFVGKVNGGNFEMVRRQEPSKENPSRK